MTSWGPVTLRQVTLWRGFGRLVGEASELRALLLLSVRGSLFSGVEGIA